MNELQYERLVTGFPELSFQLKINGRVDPALTWFRALFFTGDCQPTNLEVLPLVIRGAPGVYVTSKHDPVPRPPPLVVGSILVTK